MSLPFNPKVTIAIPVYCGGSYLREAIDSALAQTYTNIEVIVVNDGSNDNGETECVALSYGSRIRYYSQPNGGVAAALNTAAGQMSGEYFSWLSHDDLYVPEKVETQITFLSTLPEAARAATIVYSNYYLFTADADKSTPIGLRKIMPQDFRHWITCENSLNGCTLLIPKAAFTKVGNFNTSLRTTQDYDLWFRLGAIFDFQHINDYLIKARQHSEQGSVKLLKVAKKEWNVLFSYFVCALTQEELWRINRNTSIAYAYLASRMWYRGFMKAGWVATKKMFAHFSLATWHDNIAAIYISFKGIALYSVVSPFRKFLSPQNRRCIINKVFVMKKSASQILKSLIPAPIKRALLCMATSSPARHSEAIIGANTVLGLGLKDKFSQVYEKNIFRGSVSRSGEGSDLVQTQIIRQEIPALLRELNIQTFLDAPCGDWYWMQHVNLPVKQYIGVDIVEPLIKKNQSAFANATVSFQCLNLAEDALPKSDLIFSRDCLVHLSFADARRIIANFKRSGATYLLTTTFTERSSNADLGDSFWRPLNKQAAPFNFPAPLRLINEGCTEGNNLFTDKCLGLWRLDEIQITDGNE